MTCTYRMKRGWYCLRDWGHAGPCALRPHWWNVLDWWRFR
jgi:hypothetical protein